MNQVDFRVRADSGPPPWPAAVAPAAAIDARSVLAGIWRRKMMVLGVTLIAGLLALAFVITADREYTATAQVLVDVLETPFDRSQPSDQDRRLIDERDIASQVEVLRSRDLAKRVVSTLNLTGRPEFDPLKKGLGFKSRILIMAGFKRDPRKQTPEQRALSTLAAKLKAYQVEQSKVIEIEGSAGDPRTAADLANTLADLYVTSTREAQSETTARSRQWLSDQIEQLREKVLKSEDAVEAFRSQAGLIKGPTTTLSTQELAELNTQIILAESAKSEAQAKARAIRDALSKGSVDTSSAVLNSPLIQRLREQQIALQRTQAELSSTFLGNHPRIISVRRELDDLNKQVRAEALKIVEGLEQDARVAASRESALRESLNNLKAKASETNIDEVKLRALEREAAANRTLLESFLTRFSDASARQEVNAQPGLARVISRADPPSEPSFPRTGPIILLATLAGFTVGLGLAFMAEVMTAAARLNEAVLPLDNEVPPERSTAPLPPVPPPLPVRTPAPAPSPPVVHDTPQAPPPPTPAPPAVRAVPEAPPQTVPPPRPAPTRPPPVAASSPVAERAAADPQGNDTLTLPSLCVVPRPSAGPDPTQNAFKAAGDLASEFARSLRPLTSWCMSLRQTLGVRRIAVWTGEGAGIDGATAVCVLARSLAAEDVRTVLVDTDRYSGWLAAMFGLGRVSGLSELLAGEAKFSDVIVKDNVSRAHIIRAGPKPEKLPPATEQQRLGQVLEGLEQAYDMVLVHIGKDAAANRDIVAKCHAAVLFAVAQQSRQTAAQLATLGDLGLSAIQYVRLADFPAASPESLERKVALRA